MIFSYHPIKIHQPSLFNFFHSISPDYRSQASNEGQIFTDFTTLVLCSSHHLLSRSLRFFLLCCIPLHTPSMSSRHVSQLRKWMLASPPIEWGVDKLRELLIGALRQGPIPQHVAFVMDGNRRFARSHKIETVEGHNLGFEALARV